MSMKCSSRHQLGGLLTNSQPLKSEEDPAMQLLLQKSLVNLASRVHFKSPAKAVFSTTGTCLKTNTVGPNVTPSAPKQNLLKFPALPLNETLTKFIKTTEPLLSKSELEETIKATDNFLQCEGPELQKLLEKQACMEENWLAERWLRVAYLQYRNPVPIHSSPGMTFPMQQFCSDDDFLLYTAKIIFILVKYKDLIDQGKMPIQKMGKFELDNSQFHRVFGTCRVPGIKEDSLEFYPRSTHIAVIFRNHFYEVPVYTYAKRPLHPEVIFQELKDILKFEKIKGPAYGILSSDHRDNWGVSYSELLSIPGNDDSVRKIQKSLFTVSLDQEASNDSGKSEMEVAGLQLLHGGGPHQNGGNRWFDKTIQVIVNRSGVSGFCYEHSPAEGQPIALMTDYVIQNLNNEELFCSGEKCDYPPAAKLELKSSPALDKQIAKAKCNLSKLSDDIQLTVLHYKGYGKGFLKKMKLSPDSYIQMAFQYAFFKLHDTPGACYESAHLRVFYNGRTETIRSCSNESIAFACAMLDKDKSSSEKADLLRTAVKGHREYTTMALHGRGVDRHLLGLKLMAIENKRPIPDFFKCPGFVKSTHFRLSTSQVASVNKAFMCYGPTADDGYSCCYNPRENDIIVAIGSWKSNTETCSERFAAGLCESFDSMMDILLSAAKPPTSKM